MAETTTPTDGQLPNQGIYAQKKAEAEAAYQRALANLARQRSGVLQQYGFQATFDEDGNVQSYGVDPGNEYGLYQQSRNAQAVELDDAAEQSRLSGFSSKGFGAQAESRTRYAQGAQNVELGRSFLDNIYGLASGQRDALADKTASFLGIEQEQMYEALTNRLFNEAEEPETPTIKWGGKDRTKEGLIYWLRSKGVDPSAWALRHSAAAEKLGIKPDAGEADKQARLGTLETWINKRLEEGWTPARIRTTHNWREYANKAQGSARMRRIASKMGTKGPRRKARRKRR